MSKRKTLSLPKILSIKLNDFSLYTLKPTIDLTMGDGVFCLAGANGLGKSTFLNALNYAITGIVRNPSQKFASADEYYNTELGKSYSNEYFDGRIKEHDRETSSIFVRMQVGNKIFEITRGVFEPGQLQQLLITEITGGVILDGTQYPTEERNDLYQDYITKEIGLNTFHQFVFLQLFVFTFDESRYLLLWNKDAVNTAIFLCVGGNDLVKVQQSEKLKREMERAGSRARNIQYQASNLRNDINKIQETLGLKASTRDLEDLAKVYESLQSKLELAEEQVDRKRNQLNDTQLKWSEANSELATLQVTYSREFNSRIQRRTRVELHPTIASSLSNGKCVICGSHSKKSITLIQTKIENNTCPLCESPLPKPTEDALSLDNLRDIDKNISGCKKRIDDLQKMMDRVSKEYRTTDQNREARYKELDNFEKENEKLLYQLKASIGGESPSLQGKIETLKDLQQKKKSAYLERDKKRDEYLLVQKELDKLYKAAQGEFVPLFRNLASSFLGMDVDIKAEFGTSSDALGVSLVLEIQGKARRDDQQLSESQRFFVDIAFRMAVAQFMSGQDGDASLYIDTPEGSLDIAYESRVGKMFAEFVNQENNIIMTANINSSQILLKLAALCGMEKMALQQMTTWTELSEVQIESDDLFTDAIHAIEEALTS